eukprot:UN01864
MSENVVQKKKIKSKDNIMIRNDTIQNLPYLSNLAVNIE